MKDFSTRMLEIEDVRRSLMEIQMKENVIVHIQKFFMLMYQAPIMTPHEAFSLLMWGLEHKIREHIRFHAERDMGKAMQWQRRMTCGGLSQKGLKMGKQNMEGMGLEVGTAKF